MIAADYVGLGTLITAIGATIVSIIIALRQKQIGGQVNDVHTEVTSATNTTMADTVDHIHDVVCDGKH